MTCEDEGHNFGDIDEEAYGNDKLHCFGCGLELDEEHEE